MTRGWPPLYVTPVPTEDIRRGDGPMVIKRLETLCTVSMDGYAAKGGSPLVLRDWQKQLIMRLFARRPDGTRNFTLALIGMPRKNGKSAIGSGLALDGLLFDGIGANVYSAAAEKEQAGIVFEETKRMIMANEDLAEVCVPMRNVITVPETHSLYRVLSAEAYSKEGLNISRAIIDELHAHPNDELFNVLQNGTGGRAEPMIIVITTAGVMSDSTGRDSVCYSLYKKGVDAATGVAPNDSFFFCWWGAPDGADHTDPEVWEAANPGYGDILNPRDMADKVQIMPENDFRTKRLNQWTASTEAWLPGGAWDRLADTSIVVPPKTRIVLGFDGSRSRDATALIGITVLPKDKKGEPIGIPHVFVPSYTDEQGKLIPGIWERADDDPPDWQVPVGDVLEAIRHACLTYDVAEVAVDQSLWQTEMEELAAPPNNLPIVQHPQRATMMVPATQRFYEAVTGPSEDKDGNPLPRGLTHDGDPRLARHLRHAILKYTSAGPQLYKESKNSPRKIDAAIAAVMAFHRTFEVPPEVTARYISLSEVLAKENERLRLEALRLEEEQRAK